MQSSLSSVRSRLLCPEDAHCKKPLSQMSAALPRRSWRKRKPSVVQHLVRRENTSWRSAVFVCQVYHPDELKRYACIAFNNRWLHHATEALCAECMLATDGHTDGQTTPSLKAPFHYNTFIANHQYSGDDDHKTIKWRVNILRKVLNNSGRPLEEIDSRKLIVLCYHLNLAMKNCFSTSKELEFCG